ncbi:MAG: DUF2029 domain-containing protein [Opitutaceae bacterium]|nr:DUF2029 domain-containing protein [Opitutaceae bacterium]MBP9911807.1 DUF2029 domain-containing protein [Opitutaceae bacterium]
MLFFYRGVYRSAFAGNADFAAPYAGARLLITGDNPYDSNRLTSTLAAAGAQNPTHTVAVYPPGSLAAMLPFALLPVRPARAFIIIVGLGLLAFGIYRWMSILTYSPHECFVSSFLLAACAPLHTAMVVSNPALPAAGALLAGSALFQAGATRRGLLLLGFSLLLKPQLGIIGPLWLALGSRVRPAFYLTFCVGSLHLAIAAVIFFLQPTSCLDWLGNLRAESVTGAISAETQLGFQRIDPTGVWFAMTGIGLPFPLALLLAAGFIWRLWFDSRGASPATPSLQLAWLGSIGLCLLISGYHRSYDALVLAPLWLLLVSTDFSSTNQPVRFLRTFNLIWILPGAGFWLLLETRSEWVQHTLAPSFLWKAGLLRLHGWIVVSTALILMLVPPSRLAIRQTPDSSL